MQKQVLWTGGWDSTFRVLDLAITHKSPPQTHYLVDPSRPSSSKELETISLILGGLKDLGVHVPTPRVTHVTELPDDDQAAQWARVLREAAPLGSQYQWLHTYARELGKPLELSVHIDDRAAAFLEPYSEYVDDGEGGYWTLKEDAPPEMALLNTFRFPILAITKTDMQRRAQKAGFSQLLELTWFCHTPLNGRPCGLCDPCRFTIEEGLARRVPLVNRATAYVRLPLKKLRRGLARLRSGQQER